MHANYIYTISVLIVAAGVLGWMLAIYLPSRQKSRLGEELMNQIIEELPVPLYTAKLVEGKPQKLVYWNRACDYLFEHYSPFRKTLAGMSDLEHRYLHTLNSQVIKMKRPLERLFHLKNNDEKNSHHFMMQKMLGRDYDNNHFVTTVLSNVDNLVEARQAADRSNNLKSAFIANMSHEIRTPLNSIVGFSSLLKDAESMEEIKEFAEIIQTNNDLLLKLIEEILDLAQMQSKNIELHPEWIDLTRLLQEMEMTTLQQINFKEKEIDFLVDNPYTRLVAYIDRNRMMQLLTNILTNAVKYTMEGSIRLGMIVQDGKLWCYVQDTGIGITPEKLSKVFERFEKLDDVAPGTGLGMAISQSIVESMDGHIGVYSAIGEGSTFWFACPVQLDYSEKVDYDWSEIAPIMEKVEQNRG